MNLEDIKAGLYWCKPEEDHKEWNCLAIVKGKVPFLELEVFSIFFQRLVDVDREDIIWGPRIEPPGSEEEVGKEMNCYSCRKVLQLDHIHRRDMDSRLFCKDCRQKKC